MRVFIAVVLFVVAGVAPASGQAINPEFVHRREYTFERMEARRSRADARRTDDRLVTYVYRLSRMTARSVLFSTAYGWPGSIAKELGRAAARRHSLCLARLYASRAQAPRPRRVDCTYVEECSVTLPSTVADSWRSLIVRCASPARPER